MSAPEPDHPVVPSSRSGMPLVGWSLLLLLVVYPLSVAPVVKLAGVGPPAYVMAIYKPLQFLYDNVPGVEKFYNWYFKLWGIK